MDTRDEDYVLGIQKLSINDVFKKKDVLWPSFESSRANETTEFRSLVKDIVEELVNSHGYSEENAEALKKEDLYLLNHPTAIQRKASLQTGGAVQFEVASERKRIGFCFQRLFDLFVWKVQARQHLQTFPSRSSIDVHSLCPP